ncbi:hypothetical protein L1987_46508 [Smallanthus sonchifolius]|uniref:Uncharacterized protein n=1 Tax=Smallanthus sonchifolius TaxID=185202 RepID=A0ACB9G0Y3_9ASTR|nr:hypothetical protein L1987_46508 [Smallanthus sonchifolius]
MKCGKTGHLTHQCTSPVRLRCTCYKSGHFSRECPELRSQTEKTGEESTVADNEIKRIEALKPRGRAFQITTEEVNAMEAQKRIGDDFGKVRKK